jgi:hypothetical protein
MPKSLKRERISEFPAEEAKRRKTVEGEAKEILDGLGGHLNASKYGKFLTQIEPLITSLGTNGLFMLTCSLIIFFFGKVCLSLAHFHELWLH